MLVTSLVLAAALSRPLLERPGFDVPPADQRLWQLQEAERIREEAVQQAAAKTPTDGSVRALLQLQRVDEALDAVMRIVNERPRDGAGALRALGGGAQQFSDGTRDYSAKLNAIFAAAGVAARYEATHAAAMASIQLLTFTDLTQRLAGLDAIVAAHPRTDVAGAALYQKGLDFAHNAFVTRTDRHPDPTERFMRVLAISRELESGRYPAGAWSEKAASLVVEI